jgi:DeoR/GlpR family transcriptional regulator of sugar metabolism
MIKHRRQLRIVEILRAEGSIEVSELTRMMPEVSEVTLRRDIAELAEAGALKRTHGGAVLPDAMVLRPEKTGPRLVTSQSVGSELEGLDAIILPPVSGRGAEALRYQIKRKKLPFLAESAEQAGGVYLGPDNLAAGLELGQFAGQSLKGPDHTVLVIHQPDLANICDRADGFEAGLKETASAPVEFIRVNGQGSYRQAYRAALDALRSRPDISVVFGVNDHSALAGIEAAKSAGAVVKVFATGGENPEFVGRLAEDGPLCAISAFFPDVVGTRAIDLMADALAGRDLPERAITPHALLTASSLDDYYVRDSDGVWQLCSDCRSALIGSTSAEVPKRRGTIGFMPHFPAHDWYRIMIQSMTARAQDYGFQFRVTPPHKGIAAEVSRLRMQISQAAVDRIAPGQTVIIGDGEANLCLAETLRNSAMADPSAFGNVTVITNALDVLMRLEQVPSLKVILTSGEYQKADRCLVGPSLGALFERMRADLAFVSAAGLSAEFGISALDERVALANSRFVNAARRTVVLADSTAIGADANHRIARPGAFHEVITDDGALPADRQRLRAAGIDVLIAGEEVPQISPNKATRSGDA